MAKSTKRRVRVRQKECNACMSCQAYCSTAKEEVCSPTRARVRIQLDPFDANHRINICRQCEKAACVEACPEDAIALSADGTRVAFAWTGIAGETDGIWVKQRISETPLRLSDGPGRAAWPT